MNFINFISFEGCFVVMVVVLVFVNFMSKLTVRSPGTQTELLLFRRRGMQVFWVFKDLNSLICSRFNIPISFMQNRKVFKFFSEKKFIDI